MSYSYESIPADTRSAMDNVLNLDNDTKKAMAKLWRLYLRVNHGDAEYAEQDLQNFVNELHNRTQDSMLTAINQKIAQIQQEEGITAFGLKRRKTGKKRKRNSRVASRKIRGKKRKRRN